MDFSLTDQQQALRDAAAALLRHEAGPEAFRRVHDGELGTDDGLWAHMHDMGWPGVMIPEPLGGLGLGVVELVLLQEEAGRALASAPFYSTACTAVPLLLASSPGAARDELLRAIATEGRRVSVAYAETGGCWDPAEVHATAIRTEAGFALKGRKVSVADGQVADELLVVVRTAADDRDGLSLLRVPVAELRHAPSARRSLDGTRRLCDVVLDGCEVPETSVVGTEHEASPAVASALDVAALGLAAESTGVAAAALQLAVDHARTRVQFGRAIGTFQAVSHRCADMLALVESARSCTYYAAWCTEEGTPDAALATACARLAASHAGHECTRGAIQVHGGIGFTWEHDAHLLHRRAAFCEHVLGPAQQWRERLITLKESA